VGSSSAGLQVQRDLGAALAAGGGRGRRLHRGACGRCRFALLARHRSWQQRLSAPPCGWPLVRAPPLAAFGRLGAAAALVC